MLKGGDSACGESDERGDFGKYHTSLFALFAEYVGCVRFRHVVSFLKR